jgi:predicted RNA binding protein YcfA (HicA-like mRNA interferase family)
MTPLRLTGAELLKVLEDIGFSVVRVRGSHHVLRSADGRVTVIPVHGGEIIGPGLLSKILRDTHCSREELQSLLKD